MSDILSIKRHETFDLALFLFQCSHRAELYIEDVILVKQQGRSLTTSVHFEIFEESAHAVKQSQCSLK